MRTNSSATRCSTAKSSNAYEAPIALEGGIGSQQRQALDDGLGHQEPVERVSKHPWPRRDASDSSRERNSLPALAAREGNGIRDMTSAAGSAQCRFQISHRRHQGHRLERRCAQAEAEVDGSRLVRDRVHEHAADADRVGRVDHPFAAS